MAKFSVPENIGVEDFFSNHVPQQFEEIMSQTDMSAMADKEFTLQFAVGGKKYCLRITSGKNLEIVEGGIEKPILALTLNEDDWRDSVTGKVEGVIDQFTDPSQIADPFRYNKLVSTKGTMDLELKKDDGSSMPITMVFNGTETPHVALSLALSDWVAMQKKEVNGQVLFMNGKMQTKGDLMFLMSLQALI